ncbi:MAG: radical SAM protein [Ferruginibacter sp.]
MKSGIKHFNLEITKKCNQKCFYCFNDSGYSQSKNELTLTEWKNSISEIADLGYQSVHITGGEPFLHPAIVEILDHAINKGLSTTILSNGFKIAMLAKDNPDLFRKIKTAQISLDSTDPETHNSRRGFRNAYADAISAIAAFSELNVPIEISTTVSEQNINHLLDIGLFCKSIGAALILRPLISAGRASNIQHNEYFIEQLNTIKSELINTYQVGVIDDRFCYVADENESDRLLLENGTVTVEATGKIRGKIVSKNNLNELLLAIKAA